MGERKGSQASKTPDTSKWGAACEKKKVDVKVDVNFMALNEKSYKINAFRNKTKTILMGWWYSFTIIIMVLVAKKEVINT